MALKRIYSARDDMQASFLRSLLAEQGISATVMGEVLGGVVGAIPKSLSTASTVWVHAADVDRAKAVVAQFDARPLDRAMKTEAAPWKCPNCGEMIEGQFSDCWNCMTARPDDGESEEAADTAPADLTIRADLICSQCEYNLRGLTPKLRCPECGLPILRSLLDALGGDMAPDADELQRVLRQLFEAAGPQMGYTAGALVMVCHVWLEAGSETGEAGAMSSPTAAAGRVCVALRDAAIRYFGTASEAKRGLREWGIRTSDDVGKVIAGLMDVGIVEGESRELVRGFEGLCNLDGMFMEPGQ